jgi:bifunctional non-homologous end joining protein LigD
MASSTRHRPLGAGEVLLRLPGAAAAAMPGAVEPALPTLVAAPPAGPGWLHEIKLDGYRILARVEQGKVTLGSRRGNDWTGRLPELAEALRVAPLAGALFDGELVSLDARGASDFQRLQEALASAPARRAHPLVYYAFDLLYLDGVDLRGVGLARRKAVLSQVIAGGPAPFAKMICPSEHVVGQGPAFFAQVARMGLEGIVSKQTDAPYRSGRTHAWLKVKHLHRQEFVVVGYTNPKGSRSHLGALLLATFAGDDLVYRGRVGTGFREDVLQALYGALTPLRDTARALANPPTGAEARDVNWVKPNLVAEVSFTGLTQDGLLRHSTFLGVREDKEAREVVLDLPRAVPACDASGESAAATVPAPPGRGRPPRTVS